MYQFSVIVPTYNSATTIDKCLQSVIRQTCTDLEIIVIDGLSTDGTQDLVKPYIKAGNVLLVSEKDKGIYDAMNKGIAKATGKWLYFLGSDDELYNDDILTTVSRNIAANPESKFVYGDVITSGGTIERYKNYGFKDLLTRSICHQSIFYHHTLFDEELYDLQYRVCADWDLNLKLFTRNIHPIYINQIIAKFDLGGVSGEWMHHPEYLAHFSNKKEVINRYRGKTYLYGFYYPYRLMQKLQTKLVWIFQ